jgi:hypothetical protein
MTEPGDYETWESWFTAGTVIPDAALMTRQALLSALHGQGVMVSTKDLKNWQAAGVIPYGARRWHGATGTSRTLYPQPDGVPPGTASAPAAGGVEPPEHWVPAAGVCGPGTRRR